MYHLIESNIKIVLGAIPLYHVSEYDWLARELRIRTVSTDKDYQERYAKYWGLSSRYVSAGWLVAYFAELEKAKKAAITSGALCLLLYSTPSTPKGKKAFQYSFSSKVVHSVNPREPIFDSKLEMFYFFARPGLKASLGNRIARHDGFMDFLRGEYRRVIESGLLAQSIAEFRLKFAPKSFTDEKIIDSLIWAWVKVCKRGAIIGKKVQYD